MKRDIPVAHPQGCWATWIPSIHTSELWTRAALPSHLLVLPIWRGNGGSGTEHPGSTLAGAELGCPCGHWLCVSGAGSLILPHVCQHPRYSGCLLPCSGHHGAVLPVAPGPRTPARSFAEVSLSCFSAGNRILEMGSSVACCRTLVLSHEIRPLSDV